MRVLINRALIAISAFFYSCSRERTNNKTVLIVFQQLFGDAIIIQNSLGEYIKLFPQSEGWSVHFLARPDVLDFMKITLPLPKEMFFEKVDFKRFLEDYTYYREIVAKYRNMAGMIIVPGTSLSAEIFTISMSAKRKVGLIRSVDITRPWIYSYFYRNAYKEKVRPDKEDMMLQRHRKLINYLGNRTYRARLPKLIDKKRYIEESYAVVCPGSSKMEKCWPIERFAYIADYIVEQYGWIVLLCGGTEEKVFADQIKDISKHKEHIVSCIGKTDFSDWSAIVQNANLVVGNDSATMHLAAAAKIPAVCIAGVYDKYQFFPYKVDISEERLPVTVLKDMPCEWCRTIGYDAGYGNEECQKSIREGYSASCISGIETNSVIDAIHRVLKVGEPPENR